MKEGKVRGNVIERKNEEGDYEGNIKYRYIQKKEKIIPSFFLFSPSLRSRYCYRKP